MPAPPERERSMSAPSERDGGDAGPHLPDRPGSDDVAPSPQITEHGTDLFSHHGRDGRYLAASPNYEQVVGYPAESLEGQQPDPYLHVDDRAAARAAFERTLAEGGVARVSYRFLTATGALLWFESTMNRTTDPDTGEVVGVQVVSRDITEHRREWERQERRDRFLRLLLDVATQVVNRPLEELDEAIDDLLAATGRFTRSDRAYVFRCDATGAVLSNTHEWCRRPIASMRAHLQRVPVERVQRMYDALTDHDLVEMVTARLPEGDPLRAVLEGQSVHTVLAIPMRHEGELLGFVGLDAVESPPTWNREDHDLLRVVAELCTNAVVHLERERALRRSQTLLESAGALARFGGWVWEIPSDKFTLSPELRALLGLDEDAGNNLDELLQLLTHADATTLEADITAAVADGTPWDRDIEVTTPTGARRWFRSIGTAERGPGGEVVRLHGAAQDITDQREAERRHQRLTTQLASTMDTVSDGIAVFDADRRLTYANHQLGALLDLSREELIGHRLDGTLPEHAAEVLSTAVLRTLERGLACNDLRHLQPQGRWLEVRSYPSDGDASVYVRDITRRIERERDLEAIAEAERAAASQLRELDQVKNAFLSAVSHELRTPLTVIRGLSETLRERRGQLVAADRDRIEDAIAVHSVALAELLDELLQLDRLIRGHLTAERERVELVQLAAELVAASDVPDRVRIHAAPTVWARVDRVQVESIVKNLLVNADKYAPGVAVDLRLTSLPGEGVRLEVVDRGPGIPEPERERVFAPFVRLAEAHPRPGTGVGLTLVAEFARLHGGRAWAAAPEGAGAHLVVELPGPGGSSGAQHELAEHLTIGQPAERGPALTER